MLVAKNNLRLNDKKHPKNGKLATALGVVAWIVFVVLVVKSVTSKGHVGTMVGAIAVADAFCTVIGIGLAFSTLRSEDALPLFSWIGIGINAVLLAVYVFLFVLGVV